MRQFNKLPEQPRKFAWSSVPTAAPEPGTQPLIYGTYQAYLRRYSQIIFDVHFLDTQLDFLRAPEYLVRSIEQARREGFALDRKSVV